MVVLEALGKKVDPSLWEMMKQWSALDAEIADANAKWEKMLRKALREPKRPEMRDKIEGTNQSEGLFGTRWLMTMDEALQVLPEPEETTHNMISHFGKFHGRRATFSYYFKNDLLTEIWLCLNKSSEKEFKRMHAQLSADFGPVPPAAPTEYRQLSSKGEFDGLEIEHWLWLDDLESVGLTEFIKFRKTTT